MSQEKMGIVRKARSFLFNIGVKAHRQLTEEKAKSESLLRRIEADLATGTPRYAQARSISLDFDGVLATLVLGRAWEKTRAQKKRIPLLSPLVHGLKATVAALTEGLRRPFPQAEDVLRQLCASQKILYVLTSRTGERVPAAERWLEKFAWQDLFERLFFNLEGEYADRFKAKILRSTAIDVHVDDDTETLSYLSREFPEKLFVHMNCYHRKSPAADNIIVVHSWAEIPGIFGLDGPRRLTSQNEKATPA